MKKIDRSWIISNWTSNNYKVLKDKKEKKKEKIRNDNKRIIRYKEEKIRKNVMRSMNKRIDKYQFTRLYKPLYICTYI